MPFLNAQKIIPKKFETKFTIQFCPGFEALEV